MGEPASQIDDEIQPGLIIADRYRLERPIGSGGMATIWEATHVTLKRSVALKFVVVDGISLAGLRGRFLREARVAAAIRHRNVIDIVDFGTTDEGQPFMAMELLAGCTLADRMEACPGLGTSEAVRILAQLLSGLAAVHDAGIVHRDLKPENAFLAEDADGVIPKLLDFGVSRALDRGRGLASVLPTLENAIVGTPQYMSPEQARGLAKIDQRSDLWSAGVILYELLTGALPFDAEAIGDVIVQVATKEPPDLATLRPDLKGPLANVVRRAMQRDPDERYQSAREMRTDLLFAVAATAHAMSGLPASAHEEHATAQELLKAVEAAYEPGDSGLLRTAGFRTEVATGVSSVETEEQRVPSVEPKEPPRRPRPRAFLAAAIALAFAGLAAGVSAAREPAEEPITRSSIAHVLPVAVAPIVSIAPVASSKLEPSPVAAPVPEPEIVEAPAPPPRPLRRARLGPTRADGLLRDPGF
jgi:serine/threonine-protein kinase